jgi:DNA processing protein
LSVSERSAYLFLSLLQARVGSSLISRLGDVRPADVLEMPATEVADRMKMTENASQALEELRQDFDPDAVYGPLKEKGIGILTPWTAAIRSGCARFRTRHPRYSWTGGFPRTP